MSAIDFVIGLLTVVSFMTTGYWSHEWVTDLYEADQDGRPRPPAPAHLWRLWGICIALALICLMVFP